MSRLGFALWAAGAPARFALIGLIRLYRLTLSPMMGGACRFHPTCSVYAEEAIRNTGAVRGLLLAVWRILRCSPLSRGGLDDPPVRRLPHGSSGRPGERPPVSDGVIPHGVPGQIVEGVR